MCDFVCACCSGSYARFWYSHSIIAQLSRIVFISGPLTNFSLTVFEVRIGLVYVLTQCSYTLGCFSSRLYTVGTFPHAGRFHYPENSCPSLGHCVDSTPSPNCWSAFSLRVEMILLFPLSSNLSLEWPFLFFAKCVFSWLRLIKALDIRKTSVVRNSYQLVNPMTCERCSSLKNMCLGLKNVMHAKFASWIPILATRYLVIFVSSHDLEREKAILY